ncbi:MAG: dihydrodipicolinate synthase family protein [Verrucomicrobia bacterium]|nr:dihydrodipicolinate synthase family protein [Verrucomicrobiota bacterium]
MSPIPITGGVWSATPTPLTADHRIDLPSVRRLVDHHVAMGVTGLMLAGTCGEGPWLPDQERETLVRAVAEAARGRLRVALQITDNSAARTLVNAERAAAWGAEIVVVAQPFFFLNATPERLLGFYREIARRSPLPVGFYDRGKNSPYVIGEAQLAELLEEPNLAMVKDSSMMPTHRDVFLAARRRRPGLVVLDGDEFDTISYLEAGYDGLLLGGGIFNARLAQGIIRAVRSGDLAEARRLQARMNDLMYRVYGGPKIECWMTGLKELLVRMGLFSTNTNFLDYPLTPACRKEITEAVSGADGLGYRADLLGPSA